jgi:AraC-like DNA-binding protein
MDVATTGTELPANWPVIKLIRQGRLLAVHIRQLGGRELSVPTFGIGDAYMVSIPLVPLEAEVWRNGRSLGRHAFAEGGVQLFDMRHLWRAVIHAPFESVNMCVPVSSLAEAAGVDREALVFEPPPIAEGRSDPTMLGLARALVPAFTSPSEISAQFVEQLVTATATHLVDAYGGVPAGRSLGRPGTGLATWQQRRAAHMLVDRIDEDVPLAAVAEACGLSEGHFARAFRQSFGLPPHRWLLRERIHRAAHLMSTTDTPIDQIALACGFVDQSHLSRVFSRIMLMPPGAWRRARRSDASTGIFTEVPLRQRAAG